MTVVTVELDQVTLATLNARGVARRDLSKAVNQAVLIAYPNDDVAIDVAIAAEFSETRMGVTGEDALAWLNSLDQPQPLSKPIPHFIVKA